ncbi:hypothetical protein A2716_04110 [candidate division WWE3 bacterium RIFCSPHIGHO2_01_FULL_40_23]|uniref:Uncharacterized protein n=1 Tax=candidate division WWE3 bacterium RIFCSPLOWO2_01_FULL_41_18 TaxID=1802625 RepID=A0A1F4VDK5_UNCKA|nr:MAG: hypothetical protein A2716_04110 [candidate division WWE3 bacterium RIFCSPHIGHO2_01_FULL_40_23]OGC55060.1 MAG: hypothetical protein A3A78_03720 [candidate division WWE3 bacterium RIFCSPLOWO2_01_FULL_41_18]
MNLTQVSSIARKTIATVTITVILYSIGYFSAPYVTEFYYSIRPRKEKPVIIYGKLPPIKFNSLPTNSSEPEYILNTKDLKLPRITPELVSVYKVKKPVPSFSSGKNAQIKATALSLPEDQRVSELKGNLYKWLDPPYSRELNINISTNTLDYLLKVANNRSLYFPSPSLSTTAEADAKGILSTLGFLRDQLYQNNLKSKITYGKVVNGRILETQTPIDYMAAKVDFSRTIYKVPIYGPSYDDGLLQVVVGSLPATEDKNKAYLKYIKIKAHEWSIETDTFGRYPPISLNEAWKRVSSNQGAFAKVKLKNSSSFETYRTVTLSKVFIQDITIGYYDSEEVQDYMQPVYIFQGNFLTSGNESGDVVIYYPAVSESYIAR